uniref:Uncharacterized protein n=1 Tax=Fibrocapsa japonica TaxID=94617 RepID=A0A7S2UUQ4_9STRA|mmetsp:Transcript_14354/g.21120  ORF Transcript_14354/g.21120 Transcript_14354/m.21120 type:complete len:277 (+) Transcript_14354:66-896(+)
MAVLRILLVALLSIFSGVTAFRTLQPPTVSTVQTFSKKPATTSVGSFGRIIPTYNGILKSESTPGIGEGRNLPAPSGVNQMPEPTQAAIVLGLMASLVAGTAVCSAGLDAISATFPVAFSVWQKSWPLLGPGFVLAGVSHFTLHDDFCNIYPPKGTWGFWYLPGSPSFHVNWTGIVEIVGGLMLSIGGIANAFNVSLPTAMSLFLPDGALILCALTYVVSFANIYMYTHGAILPEAMKEAGEVPIAGHVIRFILQIFLLALYWQMGRSEPLIASLL